MNSLTTLVYNDSITSINITCNTEIKINVSWNNPPLDYGDRVIIFLVYQQVGLSVSGKTDTKEYR